MKQVFLSYAHKDRDAALRLFDAIHAPPKVYVWIDENDLLPGMRWEPAIRKAIRESRFFIAMMSKKSVANQGFRHSELREALKILDEFPDDQIYLIPVRLDDVNPPDNRIRGLNYADLFDDWGGGVAKLRRSLGLPEVVSNQPRQHAKRTAHRTGRARDKEHHYHVALCNLDQPIRSVTKLARGLNGTQSLFGFRATKAVTNRAARRRIDSYAQLDVDRLSRAFYQELDLLHMDYVFCLTDSFLAFEERGQLYYNYLGTASPVHDRVTFDSVGGLKDYAAEAGVKFEVALAYVLVSKTASFFLNLDYHYASSECPMDFTEDHADIVKGLKRGRFCAACAKKLKRNKDLAKALDAMLRWGR